MLFYPLQNYYSNIWKMMRWPWRWNFNAILFNNKNSQEVFTYSPHWTNSSNYLIRTLSSIQWKCLHGIWLPRKSTHQYNSIPINANNIPMMNGMYIAYANTIRYSDVLTCEFVAALSSVEGPHWIEHENENEIRTYARIQNTE